MKRNISIIAFLAVLLAVPFSCGGGGGAGTAETTSAETAASPEISHVADISMSGFAPGRVLVKFRQETQSYQIDEIKERYKAEAVKVMPGISVHVLRVPPDVHVPDIVERLKSEAMVEYAEPDFFAYALNVPNDPLFANQWALDNTGQTTGRADSDIDAPEGWDMAVGSPGVVIAVVDTGVNLKHEDLSGVLIQGYNAINPKKSPNDDNGHGSHVAGIASARTDNRKGIAGVSRGTSIMPVKVLGASGSGTYADVSEGIVWAADKGASVINLSLGGTSPSSTLLSAVDYAWGKGSVLTCAAGNSGNTLPLYPAYYANCIATGATDNADNKAGFSNYGPWVDVAAPGVYILSAYKGKPNSYAYASGTSMATPHVAGLAGLIVSAGISDTDGNGRVNDEVRARIEDNCDFTPGSGTYWRYGRINACKALGGNCSYLALKPKAREIKAAALKP